LALLCLILLGVHLAFAGVVVGFAVVFWLYGLSPALGVVKELPYTMASMYELSVIPLFVLMGYHTFYAGFAKDIYVSAQQWLSGLPGGLAMSTTASCAVFAACSGSSLASTALFGKVAAPEMEKLGYDRGLAYGATAASTTLASLIPPSILMVVFGIIAQVSVAKLFIAGVIPGIISAIIYMTMIGVRVRVNPRLAPPGPHVSWHMRFSSLKNVWAMGILIVIILGGIYFGIFTPTEAGAIGAVGALLLGLIGRRFKKADLWHALTDTGRTSAMIFAIVIGVNLFTRLIALTGFPRAFTTFVVSLPLPPFVILIGFLSLFVLMGMFMDALGMLVLVVPIVFPSVIVLGYDPLWFGVLCIKLSEIGLITPPVGINCYILKGVAPHVPLGVIFRGIAWFLIMDFFTLITLMAFPQLTLFLPSLM
jgi:tripartite ATP-independent transporter DctM subunit